MNAKTFKEIVSKIPDDDEVIFTYSMFEFENIRDILNGKEIVEYFNSKDVHHSKRTWMIVFKN